MADDELNTDGIDKLMKALKGKLPSIRVGILGGGARSDGLTNAEVGAFHEFGTTKIPQRSFLRIPITENLNKKLEQSGAFDKAALAQVIKTKSILPWMSKVGVLAEGIILEAFASNGYGKWPGWSVGYKNKTGQILVDTQQLRSSITYEIK